MKLIRSVLIANRGEVALRIQSSCNACGMQTVAIYAPEDVGFSFVVGADKAFPLSGSGGGAYLAQDEIIDCALEAAADAIHPGYGFLSENADFAQKVVDAGLVWIGPTPECIRLMGNKEHARQQAIAAGVPVVPGVACAITNQSFALEQADSIGYPVILKDPCSGGGKGIRIARDRSQFECAWQRVTSEAMTQTKSQQIVLEKYLEHSRHIEVQIAGDGHNVIHLFDRDCSIQRKNQKIIEEAPASSYVIPVKTGIQAFSLNCEEQDDCLDPGSESGMTKREALFNSALTLARTVGYDSVGTVEFMVTPDNNFYFLEMNTRLQVEHSVTEAVTGTDIVALQLFIAQHGHLPFGQDAVTQRGHALECRIYAEDPSQKFMPSTGTITHLSLPNHPFVRIDHDLAVGSIIGSGFDPMIAKITAWGMDRAQATARMIESLTTIIIDGITTNQRLLTGILKSNVYTDNKIHTQLLADQTYLSSVLEPPVDTQELLIDAAVITCMLEQLSTDQHHTTAPQSLPPSNRWRDKQWK